MWYARAACLLGALAGAVSGAGSAAASFPGDNGKLAFVRPESDGHHIWAMGPDGSDPQRLTTNPLSSGTSQPITLVYIDADGPAWSPDGTKIVFSSNRGEAVSDFDLWTMNADGSGVTQVTDTVEISEIEPAWSPDGSRIAVTVPTAGGSQHIWTLRADGSDMRQVTSGEAVDELPDWSPDGKTIAFQRRATPDAAASVFVASADGEGEPSNLTPGPAPAGHPSWSPDGGKIAFVRALEDGDHDVFVARADGSRATNLTNAPGYDVLPVWSPDGTKIAFSAVRNESRDIYTMNADGTAQTRLTFGAFEGKYGYDIFPDWQPTKDIRGPVITLRKVPSRCASRAFSVQVSASDVSGVERVVLRLDGRRLALRTKERFRVSISTRRLDPGRHSLAVRARDSLGNRSRERFSFVRCAPR